MSATSKPECEERTYSDENLESLLNARIVVNHPTKAIDIHIQHSPL